MKRSVYFSLSALAVAACLSVGTAQAGGSHTMHQVTASNGVWQGQLVFTTPGEAGFFTDAQGNKVASPYAFKEDHSQAPFEFGFGFTLPGTDFDVSYTLTLVKKPSGGALPQFVSPACQFNISAKGPANPDIRTESYNGADCSYKVTSKGENYFVA